MGQIAARLVDEGIEASVGSRGDAYDNALAETLIGLFKTEVIHRRGPWRGVDDVELAMLEWVWWFNHHRLLNRWGIFPRRSLKRTIAAPLGPTPRRLHSRNELSDEPGAVQWMRDTLFGLTYPERPIL